jgi:hypothetical protein
MITKKQIEQLNAIVDKLLDRESRQVNLLVLLSPPFDISRPNIHDTKKEFLLELVTVEAIATNLRAAIDQIYNPDDQESSEKTAMFERLRSAVELGAVQKVQRLIINQPSDVALKNIYDTGFYYNSLRVVVDMYIIYNQRLVELKDQEKQFWSLANRAPNHYARTLALRLARLYSKEKGHRPTFGISREGNYPSTDYGRALEEVFGILGVKAACRNPATWAIEQLTDEDMRPAMNYLGGLFDFDKSDPKKSVVNALAGMNDGLSKGS